MRTSVLQWRCSITYQLLATTTVRLEHNMATLLKPQSDSIWRWYKSDGARKSAFAQLKKIGKYNYFVFYLDVHGPALQAAHADWVPANSIHVDN